jgi:(p)ppGpp synthase/HD superfamily hydrolase
VNGLPCQDIDYVVHNGDVLFVVATRNARPSPSWAAAAQCRTTRGKIRSYFRSREPGVAEEEGRRLVLDVLGRNRPLLERVLGCVPTPEALEASVRQHTGYGSLAELCFQVALAVDPHETGAMLGRALGLDPYATQQLDLGEVGTPGRHGRAPPRGEQEAMFLLSRNGRETYKLCPCCRPVDGDPLTGLRTWDGVHGEVVVVHRADRACPADARAEEGDDEGGHVRRRQDVNAERFNLDEGEGYFPVSVEARADRHRLYVLSNLVSALEGAEALLLDAALGPQRRGQHEQQQEQEQGVGEEGDSEDVITIRFLVGVRDLEHLTRVLGAFGETDGILSARRSDLLGDEPVDPRSLGLREHHRMEHGTALEDREGRRHMLLPASSSVVGLGAEGEEEEDDLEGYEYTI